MKPIVKRLATAYADGMAQFEHHRLYCIDDFAAGMEAWAEIKRDKNGFATEDCLDEMFAYMPFVIYDSRDNDIEAATGKTITVATPGLIIKNFSKTPF